jgi:hypothetical protein
LERRRVIYPVHDVLLEIPDFPGPKLGIAEPPVFPDFGSPEDEPMTMDELQDIIYEIARGERNRRGLH